MMMVSQWTWKEYNWRLSVSLTYGTWPGGWTVYVLPNQPVSCNDILNQRQMMLDPWPAYKPHANDEVDDIHLGIASPQFSVCLSAAAAVGDVSSIGTAYYIVVNGFRQNPLDRWRSCTEINNSIPLLKFSIWWWCRSDPLLTVDYVSWDDCYDWLICCRYLFVFGPQSRVWSLFWMEIQCICRMMHWSWVDFRQIVWELSILRTRSNLL